MTNAPANLLAVRSLLLAHLNIDPKTVRSADLEPAEVGIVGDAAHRGGYHCGSNRVDSDDYSVDESPRDKKGLTLNASALDVGDFSVVKNGKTHNLKTFSTWCVEECKKNAPDTLDIREIIYSPDGKTVKRWDRLGKRSTGDKSHLYHTHFSFFRDATKSGKNLTPLFRRYLISIGLIEGDDDMSAKSEQQLAEIHEIITRWRGGVPTMSNGKEISPVQWRIRDEKSFQPQVLAALAELRGRDFTDEPSIIEGVLAGLTDEKLASAIRMAGITPQALAAAIPPQMARQVVDELTRRLNGEDVEDAPQPPTA